MRLVMGEPMEVAPALVATGLAAVPLVSDSRRLCRTGVQPSEFPQMVSASCRPWHQKGLREVPVDLDRQLNVHALQRPPCLVAGSDYLSTGF